MITVCDYEHHVMNRKNFSITCLYILFNICNSYPYDNSRLILQGLKRFSLSLEKIFYTNSIIEILIYEVAILLHNSVLLTDDCIVPYGFCMTSWVKITFRRALYRSVGDTFRFFMHCVSYEKYAGNASFYKYKGVFPVYNVHFIVYL